MVVDIDARRARDRPGVVDDDRRRAELCADPRHRVADARRVGDVEHIRTHVVRPCDRWADFGGDAPAEVDPPAGERDLGAVRGEDAGEVPAEAAEGAGDEGGATVEHVLVHRSLLHATPR